MWDWLVPASVTVTTDHVLDGVLAFATWRKRGSVEGNSEPESLDQYSNPINSRAALSEGNGGDRLNAITIVRRLRAKAPIHEPPRSKPA
jgi:hypothetical protein